VSRQPSATNHGFRVGVDNQGIIWIGSGPNFQFFVLPTHGERGDLAFVYVAQRLNGAQLVTSDSIDIQVEHRAYLIIVDIEEVEGERSELRIPSVQSGEAPVFNALPSNNSLDRQEKSAVALHGVCVVNRIVLCIISTNLSFRDRSVSI
jgi:hypothetical protein